MVLSLPLFAAGCRNGLGSSSSPPTLFGRSTPLDAARGSCLPLQGSRCREEVWAVGRVTAFHPPFPERRIPWKQWVFRVYGYRLLMLLQMATVRNASR